MKRWQIVKPPLPGRWPWRLLCRWLGHRYTGSWSVWRGMRYQKKQVHLGWSRTCIRCRCSEEHLTWD